MKHLVPQAVETRVEWVGRGAQMVADAAPAGAGGSRDGIPRESVQGCMP